MKKMASHNDLRGPNSEPFYGREKAKFKENVVNTIENLTNEIAIEGLENEKSRRYSEKIRKEHSINEKRADDI